MRSCAVNRECNDECVARFPVVLTQRFSREPEFGFWMRGLFPTEHLLPGYTDESSAPSSVALANTGTFPLLHRCGMDASSCRRA